MILTDGSPIAARNSQANTALFAYSTVTQRLANISAMQIPLSNQMNALLGSIWNESRFLQKSIAWKVFCGRLQAIFSQAINSVRVASTDVELKSLTH